MKSALLIDPDKTRAGALVEKLKEGGLDMRTAPGGFYALTMLEREQPDFLMIHSDLGDMTGWEFASIARRDPTLGQVQLIHLAASKDIVVPGDPANSFDLVVEVEADNEAMARRIFLLLATVSTVEVVLPNDLGIGGKKIAEGKNFTGPLEELSFAELTQILSEGRKSGLLTLTLGEEVGLVVFKEGKIRHSTYMNSQGYQAFVTLFLNTREIKGGTFQFEALNIEELTLFPSTINATAQQLLSNIEIDVYGTAELSLTGDDAINLPGEDSQ